VRRLRIPKCQLRVCFRRGFSVAARGGLRQPVAPDPRGCVLGASRESGCRPASDSRAPRRVVTGLHRINEGLPE
jgi:hypothetical protein